MKPYAVCVIGNSHTAALARAWKDSIGTNLPGTSLTFFASNGARLAHLIHEDGAFTTHDAELAEKLAMTSGGLTRAEIAAYDAFLLVGLGIEIAVTSLCGPFGTAEHRQWGPVEKLVSKTCFTAMVEGALKVTQPFWMLQKIREAGAQPVLLCATPFPADMKGDRSFRRKDRRFADDVFRGKVIAQCQEIGTAMALRHGAEFVWQDESTISVPGFTKAKYARGGLRFGKGRLDGGVHMNEAFGAAMLGHVLARLDELSGGRVASRSEVIALKRA